MRQLINIDKWSRKKAYDTFKNFDDPYTGVTTSLNVTNLILLSKKERKSFYGTMVYFVLLTMNDIEAFKYGYGKDENNELCIYRFEELSSTVTVLDNDNELNFTRYIRFNDDYNKFMEDFEFAKNDAENKIDYYKIPNQDEMNKIQFTCLPWIRFTNFKDAISNEEKSSKPKICWGKYYEIYGEYYIDFSLLVNHAFQDGYHIGLLINNLQKNINSIEIKNNKKELSYVKN